MTVHKSSRVNEMRARIKRISSELAYANRRMFDIRTGERFMQDGSRKEPRPRVARRAPIHAH
jgi:hypothetical protein